MTRKVIVKNRNGGKLEIKSIEFIDGQEAKDFIDIAKQEKDSNIILKFTLNPRKYNSFVFRQKNIWGTYSRALSIVEFNFK